MVNDTDPEVMETIKDWYVNWASTLDSAGQDSSDARDRLLQHSTMIRLMDTMHLAINTARRIDAIKKHIFYGRDINHIEPYAENRLTDLAGISDRLGNHETIRLLHSIMGLCDETGELMQQLFEHLFFGEPIDEDNLIEEFGDTFWYLALGAKYFKTPTFTLFLVGNYAKLSARYPNLVWTQEHALTRDKSKEMQAIHESRNTTGGEDISKS